LNHCEMIADYATDIHSPPSPKTALPKSMSQNLFLTPPRQKMNCPSVRIVVNIKRPGLKNKLLYVLVYLIPILSKKIPPRSGNTVFGNE